MNGQEMLLNSVLKMLNIDPQMVDATLDDLKKIGAIARSLDERMARIEVTQARILSLLEPTPDVPTEQLSLLEDHTQ